MNTNEKILSVLAKIKETWDITPKKDYQIKNGFHTYYKKAGETYVSYATYNSWSYDTHLDFIEFRNVLTILQQEDLIEEFEIFEEDNGMKIKFPLDFDEKYIEAIGKKATNQNALGEESSGSNKKELNKITIITPQYGNFEYLWIVFNDDHENKIKMPAKNKQGSGDASYGKKLYDLANSPTNDLGNDKSFIDNLNTSIWKTRLKEFKKRNIIKQENKRIKIADGIILEKKSVQQLSESELQYYPKNICF